MKQENKEITGTVVFVENTDATQFENKVDIAIINQDTKKNVDMVTDENIVADKNKVTENTKEKLRDQVEKMTEATTEKTTKKLKETNDKPIIEHKQTTGVASYISVPEIAITPENVNVKTLSSFAVFDYLFAVIITLLLTTKLKTKLKEKITTKLMAIIKKQTFLISVFCLLWAASIFLKSDFFNIGIQGKLSFGTNLLFTIFINITGILMGLYTTKIIKNNSQTTSNIAGEKFAIWGLSVFNTMSILLFFITESLFGLLLSFILTFITSIIHFKGKDNENFEKFYGFTTSIVLFQIIILGMFFKSSTILVLFCLLFGSILNKKDV